MGLVIKGIIDQLIIGIKEKKKNNEKNNGSTEGGKFVLKKIVVTRVSSIKMKKENGKSQSELNLRFDDESFYVNLGSEKKLRMILSDNRIEKVEIEMEDEYLIDILEVGTEVEIVFEDGKSNEWELKEIRIQGSHL